MSLIQKVQEFVRAGFAGIWIDSQEPEDALRDMGLLCRQQQWGLGVWDVARGTYPLDTFQMTEEAAAATPGTAKNPSVLLSAIPEASRRLAAASKFAVQLWVLNNFHVDACLGNTIYQQMLLNLLQEGKRVQPGQGAYRILILAPTVNLPLILKRDFVVVQHELPTREELWALLPELNTEPPTDPEEQLRVKEAAAGMTRRNFEDAVSLSLIRHDRLDPDVLWEIKSQELIKEGLLKLHPETCGFDQLRGVDYFQTYCLQLLRPRDNPLLRSKGLLLVGVPGAGKTSAILALGGATGRRVLEMNMGTLRDKYMGESDKNIARALKLAEAMEPCVLLIDEVEKALAGAGGNSDADAGMSQRIFGQLLTWLANKTADVFVCCTCNDVRRIPKEFARAERFDGKFFFDVPTENEREAIWPLYLQMYSAGVNSCLDQLVAESEGWTGAEIRACCRLAAIRGITVEEQIPSIQPISAEDPAGLEELRSWATNRCLSTSVAGVYNSQQVRTRRPAGAARRTVLRPPAKHGLHSD